MKNYIQDVQKKIYIYIYIQAARPGPEPPVPDLLFC